jgi:hypothetical protein
MKNSSTVMFFLLSALLVEQTQVFADAWHQTSGCSWFSNRYKIHVGIKRAGQIGSWCAKTRANCDGVEDQCQYPTPDPNSAFNVIYARAYAKRDANTAIAEHYGGYDGTDQWYAGSDVTNQIPDLSFQPMIEKMLGKKERYGQGRLQIGEMIFDTVNHTVQLVNIQGNLAVKTFDKANDFSTFTISITVSDDFVTDDFSDETYKKQLIWASKAMIRNGQLLLEGKFNIRQFALSNKDERDEVGLSINNMLIEIPKNIDMNRISVNVGVDICKCRCR